MVAPALETKTLEFSKTIDGSLEHIWSMLNNRDDLCDWLCYDAHVRFNADDGFATFIWDEGPHVYGVYKDIVENEKIVMSWHDGTNQVTKVKFKLEEADGKVKLNLWHKGFTDDERTKHYEDLWDFRLNELQGIVETGARPHITDRVIVGVMIEAQEDEGTRVGRVVEGYSAEAAGIQDGDVILAMNGKRLSQDFGILEITQNKKPGDEVEVTYAHDGEEKTVTVALKGHPIPPIPKTFEEMATQHESEYERVNKALIEAIEGVSPEVATFKPADDQENILETLAIMINRQRHTFEWLSTYAASPRRINGYYRVPERIQALVTVYPTSEKLFKQLKQVQAETIALIDAFNKDLEKRKDYLWWMTFEIWITEDEAMGRVNTINERKEQAAS